MNEEKNIKSDFSFSRLNDIKENSFVYIISCRLENHKNKRKTEGNSEHSKSRKCKQAVCWRMVRKRMELLSKMKTKLKRKSKGQKTKNRKTNIKLIQTQL